MRSIVKAYRSLASPRQARIGCAGPLDSHTRAAPAAPPPPGLLGQPPREPVGWCHDCLSCPTRPRKVSAHAAHPGGYRWAVTGGVTGLAGVIHPHRHGDEFLVLKVAGAPVRGHLIDPPHLDLADLRVHRIGDVDGRAVPLFQPGFHRVQLDVRRAAREALGDVLIPRLVEKQFLDDQHHTFHQEAYGAAATAEVTARGIPRTRPDL